MEILILLVASGLYFLPSIFGLHKRNLMAIFILNLFLGWTVIGWIVALIWAFTKDPEKPNQIIINSESKDRTYTKEEVQKMLEEISKRK